MRRRGGPVPYELLGRSKVPPGDGGGDGRSAIPAGSGAWGPGRTLRLPVGVVPIGAAGMIVVAVLAYAWGFSRGRHDARLEAGRALEASMASRSIADPLAVVVDGPVASPTLGGATAPPEGGGNAVFSPVNGPDPRRTGLNYFVLAHATPETAPDLATFCRGRGLEAYVVADHNGVARKVVVLPGYVDGERRSDRVETLERRIIEVGLAWKSQRRGNADFSGYYPELHRGPAEGG